MDLSNLTSYLNFQGLMTLSYELFSVIENPAKVHMGFIPVFQNSPNLRELSIFSYHPPFEGAMSIIKEFVHHLFLLPNLVRANIGFFQMPLTPNQLKELAQSLPFTSSLKTFTLGFKSGQIFRDIDSCYKL